MEEGAPLIDLHVHTIMSDGNDLPQSIVSKAKANSLVAIAITDHDTVAGVMPAMQSALSFGIEIIPGIEMSVHDGIVFHMIGLFIDIQNDALLTALEKVNKARIAILTKFMIAMRRRGHKIEINDVLKNSNNLSMRRIKDYLENNINILKKDEIEGIMLSAKEEWGRRLPNAKECIELIHASGGLAILAHPFKTCCNEEQVRNLILKIRRWGLDGVEVVHPNHSEEERLKVMQIAYEYSLLYSGGSDYHGKYENDELVSENHAGGVIVPKSYLDAMKNKLRGDRNA